MPYIKILNKELANMQEPCSPKASPPCAALLHRTPPPPPRPCVSPGVGLPLTEDQDPGVAGEGCI